MVEVSYIIPVCRIDSDILPRLNALNFQINNFLAIQRNVKIELILVEQVIKRPYNLKKYINIPKHISFKHIVVKYPIFSKSWLYNVGFRSAKFKHCFVAEMEISSLYNDHLIDIINHVTKENKNCYYGCKGVFFLGEELTKNLIDTNKVRVEQETRYSQIHIGKLAGGLVYFKKCFWMNRLGGANECFSNLLGNDNEIAIRTTDIDKRFKHEKFNHELLHLYHPVSKMKKAGKRSLNRKMVYFTRRHCKLISHFLSTKKLGNIKAPLMMLFDNFKKEINAIS